MHATSKLRSLRKLKTRDHHASSSHSPTMHATSRRDTPFTTKHMNGNSSTTMDRSDMTTGDAGAPRTWRRNSSAEIPIPSFMIPCSASSLMDTHYALASQNDASSTMGLAATSRASSFAARPNFATAISQR